MKAKNVQTRTDYYQYIDEKVDYIEHELRRGMSANKHRIVQEHIDGDRIIINFRNCIHVLELSENEPEERKNYITDNSNYREVIRAMAYSVFRRDIYDEIADRDIDLE